MAALSTRVDEKIDTTIDVENHKVKEEVKYNPKEVDLYIGGHLIKDFDITERPTIAKQENKNMNNTLRELTVTLIDNNVNLEDDQRIVFKKKEFVTSASNEDVKLELIATGEVMPALKDHNEQVRAKTVREDLLESTGREVMLKPIKKLSDSQLEWRFVATA